MCLQQDQPCGTGLGDLVKRKTLWHSRLGVDRKADNPTPEKETKEAYTRNQRCSSAQKQRNPCSWTNVTRSKLTAAMHPPCIKPAERSVAQVVKEIDRYRMDIIKISEARWMGSRMMKERSGYTVTRGEPTHQRRVDRQVM